MTMNNIKQVIVIRKDIKMSKGKTAAQCCHACLESYKKASPYIRKMWKKQCQKKVILGAKNLEQLIEIKQKASKMRIACSLITDAGRTELKSGTVTCLGIGPDLEKKIDKITGSLPLVK